MEKEFIPYEQVSSLIALGFNEPVIAHRQHGLDICLLKQPEVLLTDLSMILYQQAFRWFREKYNRLHTVNIDLSNNLKDKVFVYTIEDHLGSIVDRSEEFNTYEEAELACLEKLIEIADPNK